MEVNFEKTTATVRVECPIFCSRLRASNELASDGATVPTRTQRRRRNHKQRSYPEEKEWKKKFQNRVITQCESSSLGFGKKKTVFFCVLRCDHFFFSKLSRMLAKHEKNIFKATKW